MTQFRHKPLNHYQQLFQRKKALSLLMLILVGGCSVWNSYLDPNYESSRAERLCHPYGECSQGTWIATDGQERSSTLAKTECQELVDKNNKNDWWTDSVSRGLAISHCMEKKGYKLQQ